MLNLIMYVINIPRGNSLFSVLIFQRKSLIYRVLLNFRPFSFSRQNYTISIAYTCTLFLPVCLCLPSPGRGTSQNIWWAVCRPVLQTVSLFQTKRCTFYFPGALFSDLASKFVSISCRHLGSVVRKPMKANPRLKVNPGKEKSKSKVSDKIFLKNVNCLVIKLDSEFSLIQDWFIESRLSDQMTAARTCTLPSIQIKKGER